MINAGTVALLFTDIVGSTEMIEQIGDDAAEQLRRTHFRILRETVARSGGHEVKNLGDGLMVVFGSVVDACGCAVRMQQEVERHNQRQTGNQIGVRIGLHVGEPIRAEQDYFGTPVVVAKRLCDVAQGGQIVASRLARDLVGSRGSFTFRELGPVALKGIAEPGECCEVVWKHTAETAKVLAARAQPPIVGRTQELAEIGAAG